MSRLTGSEILGLVEAYNDVYASQELTEEQIWEEVETWVNSLLQEGYDLSDYTWEEMYEAYIGEDIKSYADRGGLLGSAQRAFARSGTEQGKAQNRAAVGRFFGGINQSATNLMQTGGVFGRGGLADRALKPTAKPGTPPAPAKPGTPVAPAKPTAPTPAAAKPAPAGQTVAAAGGKGGSVTVGRQYAAELGGVKGNVTYDAAGKKTFTAASGSASPKPPTAGTPSATSPTTPAKPTPMDQFAKANPKLAAAAAERARIRGTSQTDNPLMKDMRDRLPLTPSVQSPTLAKDLGSGGGNQSLLNNPNAAKAAPPKPAATPTAPKPTTTTSTAPTGGASLYGGATGVKPVGTPLTGGIKPVPNAPSPDAKFSVATPAPAAAAPKPATPAATPPKKPVVAAHYDLFDVVLGHLLDEGYADTKDAALAIMANMSEEWKQSIVEQMTVNVADVKGGTQAARNAAAGMKDKSGNPMYKPGVGVGPDFKLKGV